MKAWVLWDQKQHKPASGTNIFLADEDGEELHELLRGEILGNPLLPATVVVEVPDEK